LQTYPNEESRKSRNFPFTGRSGQALAMGQGVYRRKKLWAAEGRTELDA